MEIKERTVNGVSVLDLKGEIDSLHVDEFRTFLQELLNEEKCYLLLNFYGVSYINSAGLGVLAAVLKRIKEYRGELKVVGLSQPLRDVFKLVRFDLIIPVYEDEDAALESFHIRL